MSRSTLMVMIVLSMLIGLISCSKSDVPVSSTTTPQPQISRPAAEKPEEPPQQIQDGRRGKKELVRAYYSIRWRNNLVGYAVIDGPVDVIRDGVPLRQITAMSISQPDMNKSKSAVKCRSVTLLNMDTGRVVEYEGTTVAGEQSTRIRCVVKKGKLEVVREILETSSVQSEVLEVKPDYHFGVSADIAPLVVLGLANSSEEKAELTVETVSGDTLSKEMMLVSKLEPRELKIGGKSLAAEGISIDNGKTELLTGVESGQFLRFTNNQSQLQIELASKDVVEKMSETCPSSSFSIGMQLEVNTRFPEFQAVDQLEAHIEVDIQTGDKAFVVLDSPMQEFEGKIESGKASGKVSTRTVVFDVKNASGFPVTEDYMSSELAGYLQPTVHVESNNPGIVALSKELAAGSKTTWEAAVLIADWVWKNIEHRIVILPSAKSTLSAKSGDSRSIANLTVAMLRAAGIPARLVGGLMSAPIFRGGFGQHAWVEVYLGEAGWVPLDPTTGEFESLSALHIKCFEGQGEIAPRQVKILDYGPKENLKEIVQRAFPWKTGQEYVWHYNIPGNPPFTEKVTFSRAESPAKWKAQSVVQMGIDPNSPVVQRTVLLDDHIRPLSWTTSGWNGASDFTMTATFSDDKVSIQTNGTGKDNGDSIVTLSGEPYAADPMFMLPWMIMSPRLLYLPGKKTTYKMLFLESSEQKTITLSVRGTRVTRTVGEGELSTYAIDVTPLDRVLYVNEDDGRLVGVTANGGITIEMR